MAIFTITTEVVWRSPGISSIPKSKGGNTNGAATVTMKSPRLETLNHVNPQFYPGIYVALVTLLTYPVSTCAEEIENPSSKHYE